MILRASSSPRAQSALAEAQTLYPDALVLPEITTEALAEQGAGHEPSLDAASAPAVVVSLGGDGHVLDVVHELLTARISLPVFAVNLGTLGFLTNGPSLEDLPGRIRSSSSHLLSPLEMHAEGLDGSTWSDLAVNEVALTRSASQAAHLRVEVDGVVRLEDCAGDGILIATPAGSTGYNASAHGPIIPLDAGLLACTPICCFSPRRWPGALLPHTSEVCLEVLDPGWRPVSANADQRAAALSAPLARVRVRESERCFALAFDAEHSFTERVLAEQFRP